MKSIATLSIAYITLLLVSFTSCKKDEPIDDDHHGNSATITFSAPTADATFNMNDTVSIKAQIEAEETVHGYDIFINRNNDNTILFTHSGHAHGTSIAIDTFWVNNVADTTTIEVQVIATVDHDGNTVGKKVYCTCLP